jgi:maleamate amidohydrolase
MSDATWETYRARGLGGKQATGARPCLVVVDLNRGFTDPDSPLHCDADAAVEATARLLDVARANGRPCVFTTVAYDEAGKDVARAFLEKVPSLATLAAGSPWVEIDERIAPRAGEPVLRKLFASAFFGVPLASLLAAHGCDSIIVCGASTSGCVRATVVDGLQHGYRVIVPREAVADRAAGPHAAALFDIQAKYGEVVSTAEACVLLGEPEGTR